MALESSGQTNQRSPSWAEEKEMAIEAERSWGRLRGLGCWLATPSRRRGRGRGQGRLRLPEDDCAATDLYEEERKQQAEDAGLRLPKWKRGAAFLLRALQIVATVDVEGLLSLVLPLRRKS